MIHSECPAQGNAEWLRNSSMLPQSKEIIALTSAGASALQGEPPLGVCHPCRRHGSCRRQPCRRQPCRHQPCRHQPCRHQPCRHQPCRPQPCRHQPCCHQPC